MTKRRITVGHSPDADDAFMFYALAREKVSTGNLEFVHELQDIETLNRRAEREELDVTALSIHAYAYVADKYALLPCGASVGDNYGPILVGRTALSREQLRRCRIAVPGTRTTAFLALQLYLGTFDYVVIPFDRILAAIQSGEADAGLVIHEGQLTYADLGMKKLVDLGTWWKEQTGLPLPLGVNGVRKALGSSLMQEVSGCLQASIRYALAHRAEALDYALSFARDLDRSRADRFVGMYVNDFTVDLGERGRHAIEVLLERATREKLIPGKVAVEIVQSP